MVPHTPSTVEAKFYYYGLPSQPILVARSSTNVWVEPTGPEAYHIPKEASPIGLHPLQDIWEATIGPALIHYLNFKGVQCTSLDPLRMGYVSDPSPPVIIWIGVVPGSLSAEDGVAVAAHCKVMLSGYNIDDVHIEIRESNVFSSGCPALYRPVLDSNPTAYVREPFSTSLGLPICAQNTPTIEGTGGFFVSDMNNPGKLYLVTARHVVFHPDREPNILYRHHNSQPRKNVLLFGENAIKVHTAAIEAEIENKHDVIKVLERRSNLNVPMDEEDAAAERTHVLHLLGEARRAIVSLRKFQADISRDWEKPENRLLGHVVLSPPISFNDVDGFTEDWAVIEVSKAKVNKTNFTGNAIDLGAISSKDLKSWMYPHISNPHSFDYPEDRLLKITGTISDKEMGKPSSRTIDQQGDPCIMVIQRGYASGLTVGRLNNIRSFRRTYFEGIPGQMSKEVAVFPRDSKAGPFSKCGDSGAAVVDGRGRLAGILMGGTGGGTISISDCTYVTSINFILDRLSHYGLKANLFPSIDM